MAISACVLARAQDVTGSNSPAAVQGGYLQQTARVPGFYSFIPGLNAGLALSGAHNSQSGWYSVITPALGYTFSQRYSSDASLSIYPYRRVETVGSTSPSQDQRVVHRGDPGDILLSLHGRFTAPWLQQTVTASVTIPTGNRADGLSTGRVTFDGSDHLEHSLRHAGLLLDLGAGDSSELFNRFLTNTYTSLGPLAHFQAGVVIWLPRQSYMQTVAYEQLPIGDQKLYTTLRAPGKPDVNVVTGTRVSEDNGLTTFLGIPLSDHVTLSSYYNRSLRYHLDTVSIGFTFLLRQRTNVPKLSLVDRALREAERNLPGDSH